jgi:quinol monooxygenase YgiN
MILVTVIVFIKPEKSSDFLNLISDFTQSAKKEKGNLIYNWYMIDYSTFILKSVYIDGESFEHHLNTPIIINWEKTLKYKYLEKKEIIEKRII